MDDDQRASQDIKAVRHLKELTVEAVRMGLSYAAIEQQMGTDSWNANAIKQFVHRDGNSRSSAKVRRLASIVLSYLKQEDEEGEHIRKRTFVRSVLDSRPTDILKFYDQKFRASRTISSQVFFPDKYSFVRYDITNERFLVISVEIITVGDQSYFVMRLSGMAGKKRVVVGSVHSTVANTHMVGLAFSVSEFVQQEDFDTLSSKSLRDLHHLLSSNPLGVEEISFSNTAFKDTYFPVAFVGLDGGGLPIAGIGMLINEESLVDFGIQAFTVHAQTPAMLPKVGAALKKLNCRTQPVTSSQPRGQ